MCNINGSDGLMNTFSSTQSSSSHTVTNDDELHKILDNKKIKIYNKKDE